MNRQRTIGLNPRTQVHFYREENRRLMALSDTCIFEADLSELARLSRFVQDFGRRAGLSDRMTHALSVALDEMLTNIIVHGTQDISGQAVKVSLLTDDTEVRGTIEDPGFAFDPTQVEPVDFDQLFNSDQLGGLGLHLVRNLTDQMSYERRNGKNITTIQCRLDRPPELA